MAPWPHGPHILQRDRHPPCLLHLRCSSPASTCINGVFGVEAGGACCVTQCGACGGAGCGSRGSAAGLTADDRCIGRIMDSNVFCDVSGTAPCITDGERFGLVLLISTGWNIARGTLYFITLLLMTRLIGLTDLGVGRSQFASQVKNLILWLLLNLLVSRQNSAYFSFSYLARVRALPERA